MQLELLPKQVPAPTLPRYPSHAFTLLEVLLRDGQIDQPEWSRQGMGWRLAAIVYDLNELGWRIESTMVPTVMPAGRPIAKYKLPVQLVKVAREALKGRK